MNPSRLIRPLILLLLSAGFSWGAAPEPVWEIESLQGQFTFEPGTGVATATNGIVIKYSGATLTADSASLNQETGVVTAEGNVVLQHEGQIWRGDQVEYNFKTGQTGANRFRAGMAPFFATGMGLAGDKSNRTYSATNAMITTDDVTVPGYKIRGRSLTVVPGKYLEARDATLYLGDVPVFYFPYYRRSLERHPNNLVFTPGYRSLYGAFLLSTYNSSWNTNLATALHLDTRVKRGFGIGPDVHYDAGPPGSGTFRYYYIKDQEPGLDPSGVPIKEDRQRVSFIHQATLRSNLTVKAVVRYQSDAQVIRDFFESEYQRNIQPNSFLEVNQLWPNFSLNVFAQPQVNDFFETVERLPDVKLSAIRQQLGVSPLFYEGENSIGYFRHATNGQPQISAWRGDSFHQLTLPQTLFGWLNVTPRVGGRYTHYSEADGFGTTTLAEDRWVFNTGAEVSFKASKVWRDARSEFWEVKELRHIIEPAVNYAYVPSPNKLPPQLPQFDSELPSLRLLPIEFPDYNAIDSIDSQNVLRIALRNKLQTKRAEGVENLVDWDLYTDWRLSPRPGQSTFADIFSDLNMKPRSWLSLRSETRFDVANEQFREANHFAVIQPGNAWSVGLGHRYFREDPALGTNSAHNLITTSVYCRFNENWAARMSHRFEARDGTMEEQYYTIYRDLRSWTSALTFRVRDNRTGPTDFTVAITFSLKAFPRYGLGHDRDLPSKLLDG